MIAQSTRRAAPGPRAGRRPHPGQAGFTLIELLAVVVVILILAGLSIRIAGYVQTKVGTSTTRAQIAAISAALESYKADWGYYPPTAPGRISASGMCEATNNWILFNALCPTTAGRKTYLRFPAAQIRTNTFIQLPNVYDGWGHPFNYYNSPKTTYQLLTSSTNYYGCTVGGQVNLTTFDLFSYGPDGYTYVMPNAVLPAGWAVPGAQWNKTNAVNDDITNWGR